MYSIQFVFFICWNFFFFDKHKHKLEDQRRDSVLKLHSGEKNRETALDMYMSHDVEYQMNMLVELKVVA